MEEANFPEMSLDGMVIHKMDRPLDLCQVKYFDLIKTSLFSSIFLGILQNISFDWSQIIYHIKVFSAVTQRISIIYGIDLELSFVPQYPNCITIDLHEHFSERDVPRQVFIRLKKVKNMGIDIFLLDKSFASKRSIKSQLLAYTGPILTNPELGSKSKTERFILKITQTKDSEEDESKGCVDYPNQRFKTFSECDGRFVHEQMIGEGIMPFWATDNLEEVTRYSLFSFNKTGNYENLIDGTLESNCPPSCLQTKVCILFLAS